MLIKSNKELAQITKGKGILILNSLGKDSALLHEWCVRSSGASRIVSVNFKFLVQHPEDDIYFNWQKKRYPQIEFIQDINAHEISNIADKTYQAPLDILMEFNLWEFRDFSMALMASEIRQRLGLDYICIGNSKYESVARAMKFYKKGLMDGDKIFPLGLMTKKDVIDLIRKTGLKIHPVYRLAKSTIDYPSYYKMRSSFIAYPEYRKEIFRIYPMLALDKYRYEILMKDHFEKE